MGVLHIPRVRTQSVVTTVSVTLDTKLKDHFVWVSGQGLFSFFLF